MNRFDKLQELARQMDDRAVAMAIYDLSRSDAFAAVLALLEREEQRVVQAMCAPATAENHPAIARAAGGLRMARVTVPNTLRKLVDPRPTDNGQRTADD